jgi:hypothetical protein
VRTFAALAAFLIFCNLNINASVDSSQAKVRPSIAYPAGALYLERGICGSFMGGKHKNPDDKQSLYLWQGEISYYYTSFFSGGVAFKIKAGEPSDKQQKILNRFFLNGRFHHAWNDVALYLGPQLGLDNINIIDGTPDIGKPDSLLKKPFDNTNASLGLDMGGGWKFSRWIGLTLGGNVEYSLAAEDTLVAKNSLNFHLNPGLAIDILAFSETLHELVSAMYFNVEMQQGFLLLEKKGRRSDRATIFGVSLAF